MPCCEVEGNRQRSQYHAFEACHCDLLQVPGKVGQTGDLGMGFEGIDWLDNGESESVRHHDAASGTSTLHR